MYRLFLITFFALTASLVMPINANAAIPTPACPVIYGGGEIDCAKISQAVLNATAAPSNPNTQPANPVQQAPVQSAPAMTKGGLPVHEPTQTRTTPATGPEMWALVSLVPMAGAGLWLKRRV